MNREEVKKILPILTAFVEDKNIQVFTNPGIWVDSDDISLYNLNSWPEGYRIKPEPTYRPFKDAEECWNEMQKHQPFGWIKSKDDSTINKFMFIDSLENNAANVCTSSHFSYNKLIECYIFADGTPFGIKK